MQLFQRNKKAVAFDSPNYGHIQASSGQTLLTPADPGDSIEDVTSDSLEDDQYGMFILEDKPASQDNLVDIVAIHGLNGHYNKTWTATNTESGQECNWLRDLLPQAVPEARIMSFGYNSAVQFSKSVADIGTFAESLLEEILSYRMSNAEKSRPIIFICYSLGGLIFKRALVRARERDRYEGLLKCIRGVVFLGTPHKGSSLAEWSTIFASILRAASFGTSTNKKLAQSLYVQSEVLRDISKSFVDRGKSLIILSFYETDMVDFLKVRVVNESSAVLGLPNETPIPLNGNHHTICRFSSANEKRYRVVWTNIKRMAESLRTTEATYTTSLSNEQQLACVRGFYMSNYETYRKRNPPRVTGTCEWFLAHEQYLRWRNELSSSLLWVSADPGCGKSVLASFLVEDLRRNKSPAGLPELICHFFFKDDSEDQRSAIFALRAILHQIFSDDRARQFHAFEVYEAKGEAMFNDFASLWEIFMAIAEDPESTNIIVVLDGLDECEIASQRQLLDALATLYTENSKWMIEKPFLKIVITSRPDNLIKNKFVKLPTIRLRGEDETEAISKDVELVIQDHVKELVQQGLPRSILDDLQAYLVKGADRTFLWTTLMIQLLKDASAEGASKSELQKILESRDIYAIYNKLLQKSSNASQARKMLRIVLAATRPLTIDEMNIALAIMPSHRSSTELEAELRFPCENYLKSLCGHFIRIIRSNIYLVHQTAREFLLQQEAGEAPLPIGHWQHSMLMHECQQVLLDICVLYLFLHEPENGKNVQSLATASKRKKLFLEYVNEGNFLDYTAKQWPVHFNLSAVELDGERMNKCLRLCDPEFPGFYNWMRFHPGFLLDKSRWDNLLRPELQLHVATLLSLEPMVSRSLSGVPLNVNACDRNQRTALHLAAEVQSLGIVKLLLKEAKIDVNATDDDKYTPLHIAVKQGSLEITKTLLEHGAEVDREDYMSNSALHLAVTVQSMNIVELLLQHDANVNAQNKHEITPLHLATKAQLLDISKLLLDNGANVNAKDQYTRSTALHQAAEQGDYDQINMILDYNPDINMTNSRGETPIKILRRQPTLNPEGLLRMKPADDDEDSDKASSSYGKEADSSSRHSKGETSVDSNASNHSSPVRGNARAFTFNGEPKPPIRRPTTAKAVKKTKPKGSWRKQIKSIFH